MFRDFFHADDKRFLITIEEVTTAVYHWTILDNKKKRQWDGVADGGVEFAKHNVQESIAYYLMREEEGLN